MHWTIQSPWIIDHHLHAWMEGHRSSYIINIIFTVFSSNVDSHLRLCCGESKSSETGGDGTSRSESYSCTDRTWMYKHNQMGWCGMVLVSCVCDDIGHTFSPALRWCHIRLRKCACQPMCCSLSFRNDIVFVELCVSLRHSAFVFDSDSDFGEAEGERR